MPPTPSPSNSTSIIAANLPQKPSVGLPTGLAKGAGHGRSVVRGVRGQHGGLSICGATPGQGGVPPTAPAAPAASSAVQIVGVATKKL